METVITGDRDREKERSGQTGRQPPTADNDVLVLQVRAFLEAAEDVDIDVETVEDLMEAIPSDYAPEVDPVGDLDSADEADYGDNEDGSRSKGVIDEEVDPAVLYGLEDEEGQQTWTAQEVKQMMHHLKERGMAPWIQEYVLTRNIPIPKLLRAFRISLCPELQKKKPTTLLYFLKVSLSRELRLRDRLTQYNTISDAVNLIRTSRRIIILTGAGISVSCGIPDFRSRDGLYASLKDRGQYDLDDPQQMFDINYFRENPAASTCKNYTQNIDTLETLAGVQRVLQCHGSFATASCLLCRRRVPGSDIETDIMSQRVALCTVCNPLSASTPKKKRGKKKAKGQWDSDDEDESDGPAYPPGIMKPDITFFGEKLTDEFDQSLAEDRERVDLLLVIGTSLKVSPVADILSHLPHSVPQILINKTPIRHINPDILLLGNADDIVQHLCAELGWELPDNTPTKPGQSSSPAKNASASATGRTTRPPQRVGDSHVWLFEGAEGGRWLQELQREVAAQTPQLSLSPLVVDSGRNTPLNAAPPAGEGSSFKKREFLEVNEDERVLKKVKAAREKKGTVPS
ncbi:hypothetical protein DXG03_004184 [Asterophora parasitica]|uniref:Deacetylase sirtuin-type domain-containing protein n=1 Tax=Asterophora parasitica TaxID=117018 RepID=A0A9P7G1A7_9AGAR|nr:hypothetical protein DXG03_004184 [Asterophora parasitica]